MSVEYSFICQSCKSSFSIKLKMAESIEYVKCPFCKNTKVLRDYKRDLVPVIYKADGFTKKGLKND